VTLAPLLESANFPDEEGRALFEEIEETLTRGGEIYPEAGSVSSSLWRMNDEEAQAVADKIFDLARHYGQG
jgi:hypothetical protein